MSLRDLFLSDVERDIPPVVYFHEQTPEKLRDEVNEYIVTGGWPADHPNHARVPDGIHEQYVRLLRAVTEELAKPGGPELPTAWISGFYGSGKSSFAKLLGLALDGVALPDGRSLSAALLDRDRSPRAKELRDAWNTLRSKIEPVAVVFDIGAVGRDSEHIHAAAVRQVQARLGYCRTEPLVADFELRLERDGLWAQFLEVAHRTLGRPWAQVQDQALAEEDFSLVMSAMFPERYTDPMAWFTSRGGTHKRAEAPEDAVRAIGDMLRFRRPDATLFLVVDEVSQYVVSHKDRVDRLRAFTSALGAALKGRVWLFALGQQKLDEAADASFLVWAKDRFPPKLRVHLAPTNIRDVVHRRLLQKKPEVEPELRALFERHRPNLKLYAYRCQEVTPDEFVETYPMLPGHIELLLQITSALRTRSSRAQGDDQAIRGLLQLLGELFRRQGLAGMPMGALVTLDQIYEVQHTALDSDVLASMARILDRCTEDTTGLQVRVAKAVALLELIQEVVPTQPELVAQCLYDRVDRGNRVDAVTAALQELHRQGLLGYSEKEGYKIQSSTGEEWDRERRDVGVPREQIGELVQEALKHLIGIPEPAKLQGRPFPFAAVMSDGRRLDDVVLLDRREDAVVRVDFRLLTTREERDEAAWIRRSDDGALQDRLVWVCGDVDGAEGVARELAKSRAMVRKYEPRRESLNAARKMLLTAEKNRSDDLEPRLRQAVAEAWMGGRMYFRGREIPPKDHGATFAAALSATAKALLPNLFPHFVPTQVAPGELLQLIEAELAGPSPKFLDDELGILDLDAGRYVPTCRGVVPVRVKDFVVAEDGVSGQRLLAHFGSPPYGYTANVVKACVAGLLRASQLRVQPDGGAEITAVRDAGVRDLFDKDRTFRAATILPAGEDDIGFPARARICKFFQDKLGHPMEREDNAIADAVALLFPGQAQRLRAVLGRFDQLPGRPEAPKELVQLQEALEQCVAASRETRKTVQLVKRRLDALRDGIQLLNQFAAELTDAAIQEVRRAAEVRDHRLGQLEEVGLGGEVAAAGERVRAQLGRERPWVDVRGIAGDLDAICAAYVEERTRLLQWQEAQAEAARGKVRARDGFGTLTADQAHHVLRPVQDAVTSTSAEAVAPALSALSLAFVAQLARAEEEANERLDEVLSAGPTAVIRRVDLKLRNREVRTQQDVDVLVAEIRARLEEQLRAGVHVRIT